MTMHTHEPEDSVPEGSDVIPMSRKGQTSLEYMLVATFLIVALVIVLASSFDLFRGQRHSISVAETRTAANDLASMTNFLCTSPKNTTSRTTVRLPASVSLDDSSIDGRTIRFQIRSDQGTSVIAATVQCNVTGTLPPQPGTFTFRGVSQGGSGGSVALNFTPEIDSLRPDAT